jgi:hypothetical protein
MLFRVIFTRPCTTEEKHAPNFKNEHNHTYGSDPIPLSLPPCKSRVRGPRRFDGYLTRYSGDYSDTSRRDLRRQTCSAILPLPASGSRLPGFQEHWRRRRASSEKRSRLPSLRGRLIPHRYGSTEALAMKAIITACLLNNASICKTVEISVSWIKTEESCVAAIYAKAQEFPEWRITKHECKKT